jgi:hypothetical protein
MAVVDAGTGSVVAATTTDTAGEVARKCGRATAAVCGATPVEACSHINKRDKRHKLVCKTFQKMQHRYKCTVSCTK